MQRLQREQLPLGGFAGVREHRLVTDPRVFGPGATRCGAWPGIGNFVYLADARFVPRGETRLHPHHEIDVISVMVEGRIAHEGSLEHGQLLVAGDVQVQRAGGEGFSHNEVNPDDSENRMLQLWVLPERAGEPAGYRLYQPRPGAMTRVYGGDDAQQETFAARTEIAIGSFAPGSEVELPGERLLYLVNGGALLDGEPLREGDLLRGSGLRLQVTEPSTLIAVHDRGEG